MATILLLTTIIALIGAYFNSIAKWQGFAIWMVTNTIFAIHNFSIGEWQQAILFVAYFLLSANGLSYYLFNLDSNSRQD